MIPPVFGRSSEECRDGAPSPRRCSSRKAAAFWALPILVGTTLLVCSSVSPAWAQEDHSQGENAPNLAAAPLGIDLGRTPSLTAEQTEYARAIGRDLVCLCGTCPREPITDCRCGWAETNRRIIQLAVQAGKKSDEILGAYTKIYDLKIRPTPPDEGLGKLSYIIPYIAAFAMLLMFLVRGVLLKKKSAPMNAVSAAGAAGPGGEISADARAELKKELEDLD